MYDLDDDSLRVLLDDTDVGISVVLPDVLEPRLAEVAHTAALQLGGVAVLVDQQLGNLNTETDVMVVEVKTFTFTWLKDFLQVTHLKFSLCFPAAVSSPEVFSPAPQSRLCLASFAAEEDWTPQPSHRSPGSWGVVLRSVGPFGFGLNLHTRDELRSHENSNSFIVAASDPFTLLIVTGI